MGVLCFYGSPWFLFPGGLWIGGSKPPFMSSFFSFLDGRQIARDVRSLPAGCDQALKTARRTLRSLRSLPAGCDCSDRCDRLQMAQAKVPAS
eukprot:scaffold5158_cov96-Skeletonema_marinoi.AAC.3